MKILKPQWINHSGFPIFSIDVHPDGTRLATGGGDNKIKIWSTAPVSLSEVEDDKDTPKLLKSMDSHFAPVNSVKWSKDGKYLASGSDDKLVMIWGLSTSNIPSFGSQESIENWVCVSTLRGHSADISEVAWSPDSKLIATCSFDKTIIIWDTVKFHQVHRLEGHTDFVKGISWDPLGRYLASQSEDKSLIVWRTSDWQIETKITEPFIQLSNTFFLRPSWSPDGQYLCATHTINNQTHTATIIERTNWDVAINLVGHKKSIVVSRYSPIIYKDKEQRKFCCVLLGGQDMTITLWTSMSPRTIMVTKTLFDQTIQDISWFPDGFSFIACSADGTVGYLSMTKDEIGGNSITPSEKSVLFKQVYGDAVNVAKDGSLILTSTTSSSIASAANGGGGNHAMLPENPDQLAMEEFSMPSSAGGSTSSSTSSINSSSSQPSTPVKIQTTQEALLNQKQTFLPSGKRRITPIFIGGGSSTQTITKPLPLSIPSHLQHTNNNNNSDSDGDSNGIIPTPTKEVGGNNDKDILIPDLNSTSSVKSNTTTTTTTISTPKTPTTPIPNSTSLTPTTTTTTTPTSTTIPKSFLIHQNAKRKPVESTSMVISPEQNQSKKLKTTNKPKEKEKEKEKEKDYHSKNVQPQSTANVNHIYIQTPSISNHISKVLVSEPKTDIQNTIIDVMINEQELQDNTIEYISHVRCMQNQSLLWENKFPGRVTLVTGNNNWSAITTIDSILHIFNRSGGVIMSNIVLRNQISFLECNSKSHLLSITCDGFVSLWNILKKKFELSNRELPFLPNRVNLTIKNALVTDSGKPVITFSNGDSFVFSFDVGEWVKVTDRLGALSEFNSNDTNTTGIMSILQQNGNSSSMSSLLAMSNILEQNQNATSTTFLEKQIWLATVLESQKEFLHWIMTYTRYITNNGNITRLQELCTELLGPSNTLDSIWQPTVVGIPKRDILKDILPIMAGNRNLQRLVGQFKDSLNSFTRDQQQLQLDF
eukprot:gene598-744_t